jgi:predicted acylesterase/phospholipase RssA
MGQESAPRPARRLDPKGSRPATKRPKIGLALAAGGPLGALYEVGALKALEECVEGLDLSDLHVYVGVSAGAFMAAHLVNGRTADDLVRGLAGDEKGEPAFDPAVLFVPAYGEWLRSSTKLPGLVSDALFQVGRAPAEQTLFHSLARLGRALPMGLFDNSALQRYLARSFAVKGRTDDFRKLRHKLLVVATDLENGTAVVFGDKGLDHVPISKAVQASTALPGMYLPVDVEGRMCVDGVLLKTLHASVGLEHGAELLFCINPLVPVDALHGEVLEKAGAGAIQRGGLPSVLSQTLRTLIYSRMKVGMARYQTSFPEADIAFFEPPKEESRLFFSNIFSFAARREVCEIGYRATRATLLKRQAQIGAKLARHGLALRMDVVEDEGRSVWDSIEGAPPSTAPVAEQLEHALERLEHELLAE